MHLSDVIHITDAKLKKDGNFNSLGLITYKNLEQLSFLEDRKYSHLIKEQKNFSCIITKRELIDFIPENIGIGVSENPKIAFYLIHNYLVTQTDFYRKPVKTTIASSANIHPTAYISEKNVQIGERCLIGPKVSILEGSIIENDVVIRSGSVIGTEGFEFKRSNNHILPCVHGGGVLLHDLVEIQANCCISKSMFGGFTELGEATKVDSLVHIAHNVSIGKRCLIAANAMIAGSTIIGDDVWIGPSVSVSSGLKIGDNASVTIGSVVTKDVEPCKRVTGNFAIDHVKFIGFMRKIR